jgi:hypothetical protein
MWKSTLLLCSGQEHVEIGWNYLIGNKFISYNAYNLFTVLFVIWDYLLWMYITEQILWCLLLDQLPRGCNHFCLFFKLLAQPQTLSCGCTKRRSELLHSWRWHRGSGRCCRQMVTGWQAATWDFHRRRRPGPLATVSGHLGPLAPSPVLWLRCSDGPKLIPVSESEHLNSFSLLTNRLGSGFNTFFAGHDPVLVVSWLWWSPLLVLLWSWHPLGLQR